VNNNREDRSTVDDGCGSQFWDVQQQRSEAYEQMKWPHRHQVKEQALPLETASGDRRVASCGGASRS
jgi:hypothetical protein